MLGPIVAVLGFIAYSIRYGYIDGAALFVFGIFGVIVGITWLGQPSTPRFRR